MNLDERLAVAAEDLRRAADRRPVPRLDRTRTPAARIRVFALGFVVMLGAAIAALTLAPFVPSADPASLGPSTSFVPPSVSASSTPVAPQPRGTSSLAWGTAQLPSTPAVADAEGQRGSALPTLSFDPGVLGVEAPISTYRNIDHLRSFLAPSVPISNGAPNRWTVSGSVDGIVAVTIESSGARTVCAGAAGEATTCGSAVCQYGSFGCSEVTQWAIGGSDRVPAIWPVPPGTAVVGFVEVDRELAVTRELWQVPSGGAAVFVREHPELEATLTAFTSTGEILGVQKQPALSDPGEYLVAMPDIAVALLRALRDRAVPAVTEYSQRTEGSSFGEVHSTESEVDRFFHADGTVSYVLFTSHAERGERAVWSTSEDVIASGGRADEWTTQSVGVDGRIVTTAHVDGHLVIQITEEAWRAPPGDPGRG